MPRLSAVLLQPARITALVIALALLLAVLGARPHAGGWNDGSRLAAVESLLERGTLVIDDSLFCHPADASARGYPLYPDSHPSLRLLGTQDKLFIAGHYHSDKPPLVSFLMAGLYGSGQLLGLPAPSQRPDIFCRVLTWLTSVLAFAVSLACLHRLGRLVGLEGWAHTAWLAAFALATFALAYTRHVNNHILQLAVVSGWCLLAVRYTRRPGGVLLVGLGMLLGVGYNLDLGSGPLFFLAGLALVAWRARRVVPVLVVLAAAAPWLIACHGLNLAIGGVLGPLNSVPAFFDWPGCPFSTANMTGVLRHGPGEFALYSLSLLVGKHGILSHNLPLLLGLPAALAVLPRRSPYRPELLTGLGWCAAAWLLYAALSNNSSGASCSIRWFVPFLAPGFFLLAVYLKQQPRRLADLLVLAGWGAVLGLLMWRRGPWGFGMVPLLWPVVGAALATWAALLVRRRRHREVPATEVGESSPLAA